MVSPARTISLGCRLNAYESDRMAELAAGAGRKTVVINTCAVTNEAVRQSRQTIRRAQKENPDAEIVVTGCAATIDPETFRGLPGVARVIPNAEKLAPESWGQATPLSGPRAVDVRAHLEVQNGCDHRCTFCIIPTGRGDARSKPPAEAAAEALALTERGAREIVLTGVDLTSYGPDLGPDVTLADVIDALLAALPTDVRIRLSSIDGAEVDDRLFALITTEPRIAPYLHLSLQAGDDMILKRMKRRHSREDAITLTQRLRAARPDIAFGADLIAGFPTETEEMFQNTRTLIEACGLSFVHVFPFSPRKGTPAARMPQHDKALIKERAQQLRAVADAALAAHLDRKGGTRQRMLIEQNKEGRAMGKLADFTDVTLDGPARVGDEIAVHINGHNGRHLFGAAVEGAIDG